MCSSDLGRIVGRLVDRGAKAEALREFALKHGIPLSRTVAVGDGANDLEMIRIAALGIAFNAKAVLREQADAAIDVRDLRLVLDVIGA